MEAIPPGHWLLPALSRAIMPQGLRETSDMHCLGADLKDY